MARQRLVAMIAFRWPVGRQLQTICRSICRVDARVAAIYRSDRAIAVGSTTVQEGDEVFSSPRPGRFVPWRASCVMSTEVCGGSSLPAAMSAIGWRANRERLLSKLIRPTGANDWPPQTAQHAGSARRGDRRGFASTRRKRRRNGCIPRR